jgi:hypothetical protein
MSNNKTDIVTRPSVIAITQDENKLRGVELGKQRGVFEVLWTKDGEASQMDLGMFAAECKPASRHTAKTKRSSDKTVAVGFDSAGVIFYRFSVPVVKGAELAAIVKLQTEARLPLPVEQMEVTWRAGEEQDGQMAITIAAARKEHLQKFVEDMAGFEPAKILLDCEGIVKAWGEFFSGDDRKAVVVSIRSRNTQVCLAEQGRLVNTVSLDMGTEDFSAGQWPAEQSEVAERFVQDMSSVLELFGCAKPGELPVFVLSDGGGVIEAIVTCLVSAGLNARASVPQTEKLRAQTELSDEDIYEYRVPIGLAMMAFEARGEELNIFEGLYRPEKEKEKRRWLHSPKVTGAIAVVMLALLVAVLYAVDVVNERHLSRLEGKVDVGQLTRRQKLIKTVALQRPDLLRLLSEINSTEHEGVVLSSVHFKKGQPVTVKGQVKGDEKLYKFQKSLRSKKGIKGVVIENASPPKDDKIDFTITFQYKGFTQKRTRTEM